MSAWAARAGRGFRARALLRATRAQATVEMAVVAPVLIVLALIVWNVMTFVSATARFDRAVPDIVLAQGVSPASTGEGAAAADASAAIEAEVERVMEGYGVEVEVVCESAGGGPSDGDALLSLVGGLKTYTCTMRYAPWPSALTLAGVDLGAPVSLAHERAVTIDPWRPGVIV